MGLDKKELAEWLVAEWDYKEAQVDEIVEKLWVMDPSIFEAFLYWVETGLFLEEPVFSGHTPQSLDAAYHLKPPASFLLLEWIRNDPDEALQALEEEFGQSTPAEG